MKRIGRAKAPPLIPRGIPLWSLPKGVLSTILSVVGKTSPSECQLLYGMASRATVGCIVEIGAYHGRSTIALALGSLHGNRLPVYSFDPHDHFRGAKGSVYGPRDRVEFFRNILATNTGEMVRLVNLSSEVVSLGWRHRVSLLWIDGDHRLKAVRRDFACWEPFLSKGALVAFHDATETNLGPRRVIADMLRSGHYREACRCEAIIVLRKA